MDTSLNTLIITLIAFLVIKTQGVMNKGQVSNAGLQRNGVAGITFAV